MKSSDHQILKVTAEGVLRQSPETSTALPPRPEFSRDGGFPQQSEPVSLTGELLDFIPMDATCVIQKKKFTIVRIKYPTLGVMDPKGKQRAPKYEVKGLYGQLLCTFMLATDCDVTRGSKLKLDRYWNLKAQTLVPANTPHTMDESITLGLSETETTTIARTTGYKLGVPKGGGCAELSASLTKTFSHSVTISSQKTFKRSFVFPEQPQPQFCAIYQLIDRYSVHPGTNLTEYMKVMSNQPPVSPFGGVSFESGKIFDYPTDTILQVHADDVTAAAKGAPGLLSTEALHEMAEEFMAGFKA